MPSRCVRIPTNSIFISIFRSASVARVAGCRGYAVRCGPKRLVGYAVRKSAPAAQNMARVLVTYVSASCQKFF